MLAGSAAAVRIPAYAGNWLTGSDILNVALIGCGGRGTGAADQVLNTGDNIRLVAMAEPFKNRLEQSYNNLLQRHGKEKVNVPPEHRFTELDGYKKAIALADVVLMASPPGFRPLHFEEAVAQGKHCFLENPVATDVPGVHKVMALAKQADEKGLKVLVGHHLRFQPSCIQLVEQIHNGAIGQALSMSSYFNSQGVWVRHRQPEMTEMEYQLWNWYYFNWLSGDHIVEQHVHNLDFVNWVKGMHPVRAQGMGGREVRNGKEYGDIFDHHYVEFEYPDGSILNSQSRHIKGCWNNWTDVVQGTEGKVLSDPGGQIATITDAKGKEIFKYRGDKDGSSHQKEQDVFIHKILNNEPMNQAYDGAISTMTAILGRMATYSGQLISWDDAFSSKQVLAPATDITLHSMPPTMPLENGYYPVPVPGTTRVI